MDLVVAVCSAIVGVLAVPFIAGVAILIAILVATIPLMIVEKMTKENK